MSEQQLTYQGILEMFQETAWQIQETDKIARESHKKIFALGSRIGEIIENMVGGNKIIDKFRALGYEIVQCGRNISFEYIKLDIRGEIDLFLEDGEIAILIEVKTTLTTADVQRHIERMEKYRRCADARGDKRRFVGAVADIQKDTESNSDSILQENFP